MQRALRTETAASGPNHRPGRRTRRESGALSTTVVGQPDTTSSWKQEVSLRIAAHKSRRGCSATKQAEPVANWTAAGSRAAQAAARVAARYAQAPSYSQMQAAEAPADSRPAEIAAPETPKAHGPAQPAFAELPAASARRRLWEPEAPHAVESARPAARDWEPAIASLHLAAPSTLEAWENECSHSHREPDLRLLPLQPVPAPVSATASDSVFPSARESESRPVEDLAPPDLAYTAFASSFPVEDRWEWPELAQEPSGSQEIEAVDPDLPIHANLIEFPRELVATRKIRPRREEGPFAAARAEMQLSIFEVDPGAISTRPEPTGAAAVAAWPEPDWEEIELEPQDEVESQQRPAALLELQLAPFNSRLMAALADSAFIAGVVLGPALAAGAKYGHPPMTKIVEVGAVLTILLAGLAYHALFLILAGTTPGMKCAGISLCTFDGQIPTPAQLRSRLGALLLSLVPVGLGLAWALFDDDHLSWHDRLSRTYLRKN